jgi:DNA-directed RNA polymerase specialized sigma24 family protein
MIRAEVQAGSWTRLQPKPGSRRTPPGFLFRAATNQEIVMYRKRDAKNDFFYAFVMFAMFAVVVFNVAAELVALVPEAYFADFDEAARPRLMLAEADAHAVVALRAA